ncbi:hypothetical protein BVRB_002760 [Beta vulgaris subsp. vulgaris]|uniref:Uncharacterized protein n=1 Tax=Beta vulgaris subsp. vulgaris TaxID=3555 RepID=A0A0J8B8A8_BETVV|nr:hypothetical protein BVRB_002760 [Beta vulgaris subsp. vulgaris]
MIQSEKDLQIFHLLLCMQNVGKRADAMTSGYAKNDYAAEAVELFKILATKKDIKPDSITFRATTLARLSKSLNDYVTRSE